jgi:hypothetical protein
MKYVVQAGQAVNGEGTADCLRWVTMQQQELQHGNVP